MQLVGGGHRLHFSSAGINRTAVRFIDAMEQRPKGTKEMADIKVLALVGSLRAASINRQLAELAAETAPDGVTRALCSTGWAICRSTTRTSTTRTRPHRSSRCGRQPPGRRRPGRDPGVQRQHSGRAEERHRLAVPPVRRQRAEGQAAGGRRRRAGPVRRGVGARRDPQVVRDRRPAGGRVARSCRCRSTRSTGSIRGRTPRSPRTCATWWASWPPKWLDVSSSTRPPEGSVETRRRLCCYPMATGRRSVVVGARW